MHQLWKRIKSIELPKNLAVCDPIQIVERYEELTGLIEKRLFDYSQNMRPKQTVRQWLSGIYGDDQLKVWDSERRNLEGFLPLGYFGDEQ